MQSRRVGQATYSRAALAAARPRSSTSRAEMMRSSRRQREIQLSKRAKSLLTEAFATMCCQSWSRPAAGTAWRRNREEMAEERLELPFGHVLDHGGLGHVVEDILREPKLITPMPWRAAKRLTSSARRDPRSGRRRSTRRRWPIPRRRGTGRGPRGRWRVEGEASFTAVTRRGDSPMRRCTSSLRLSIAGASTSAVSQSITARSGMRQRFAPAFARRIPRRRRGTGAPTPSSAAPRRGTSRRGRSRARVRRCRGRAVFSDSVTRVEEIPRAVQRMDRRGAEVVALALFHLRDGRGRIAGHDRKVIAQGRVGVILLEAVLYHLDQLGPLDGLLGFLGRMSEGFL